jgi:ubiquitin carboxyl-terminal hydrolase 8
MTETMVENTKSCTLPGYGACGLSNLGNSCYMNSAIQCMSYLPLLRSYLLGTLYRTNGDLNRDNPLGTGGKLLEEFAELLRSMWSAKLAEKSPNRFRLHLGKSNEQFACADQQDAQEFLNYMIDVLHEDSNRVRKKPYVEALADVWVEQTLLSRVGEESWRR